ncbi:MAG: hydrogenase maturation protease [Nitrosomonadales bacterium]|nr:hydrogenase maturation protease [Nitrosomonadales bacterium]
MAAPVLVFAIGNESRGDDALAPLLLRRLQAADQTELIEDYQLQVEHVTDLVGRNAVLFVDADVSCEPPFHFSEIAAAHDNSYTSHAMTPAALLHAYRQVYRENAPPAFLLRIRGYGFELGEPLSDLAVQNLGAALRLADDLCQEVDLNKWRDHADALIPAG